MKTRAYFRRKAQKERADFERATRRNVLPLWEVRLRRTERGVRVQTIGLDADGGLIYCGVHHVPELSAKWVYRLHAQWRRWRKWYDSLPYNVAQDYPAKHCPPVAWTGAYVLGNSAAVLWVRLSGGVFRAPWRDGQRPQAWPLPAALDAGCARSTIAPDLCA